MKSIVDILRPKYTSMKAISEATGYEITSLYKMHYRNKSYPYVVRIHLQKVIKTMIRDLEKYAKELERDVK